MLAAANALLAQPSTVDKPAGDVLVVRDDGGNWSDGSNSITHQRDAGYQARKILDLSNVADADWQQITSVRLSAFFCVRDYSITESGKANGFESSLEITVNGKAQVFPITALMPAYSQGKSMAQAMAWFDFPIDKSLLARGENEVILRIVPPPGKKPDDYLYLGIDNSVPCRRSWVKLDAKAPWRNERLNAVAARGEYMVRVYLLQGPRDANATWEPSQNATNDPASLIQYAGDLRGRQRAEWDLFRIDKLSPLTVTIEGEKAGMIEVDWLNAQGQKLTKPSKYSGTKAKIEFAPTAPFRPAGIEFAPAAAIRRVTITAQKDYHPREEIVDMTPAIAAPRGKPADRQSACRLQQDSIVMETPELRCAFSTAGAHLRLASLFNEWAAAEMVNSPDDSALFMVEVEGKRYAGSKDFLIEKVEPLSTGRGFVATLRCDAISLEAKLIARLEDSLRLGLTIHNRAAAPTDFKLAFPHLSGLKFSKDPAGDYYFYPLGGGIMNHRPALIRQGYGDHQALYQIIDLYRPDAGAGLAITCADREGHYKVLALRKSVPGKSEFGLDTPYSPTSDEFKWTNSLDAVPGTGVAFEYLRRTRAGGESFVAQEIAIAAHRGDWKVPFRHYVADLHCAWKFRPHPSRLTSIWTMPGMGWGQDPLFKDGRYLTDKFPPRTDCLELMSWWEWSRLGPWSTPMDQVREKLGEAEYKRWVSYFVKDPVTGELMFNNQPGDYDGYNQRFGGLAAFRGAVAQWKKSIPLVTLYTDPIRCDDNTKMGQAHGKDWGVVQPNGKHVTNYQVWNMCHDVAEYRQWVAQTMARVMRETGADGLRLDEYGHRGWACFNKQHRHSFAEWGCTEWQRAIAETSKMVHEAMDKVDPKLVLTTEHPGYDYLMPFLDGCITYDLTVLATPLRPLECNLQRFYFPECRAFELDHRGVDRGHRKQFWNAVPAFGRIYPEPMYRALHENEDAFNSRDCEPLVPTLRKYLYANRFAGPQKIIHTLYNQAGHTISGSMVAIELPKQWHVVELLSGQELQTRPAPSPGNFAGATAVNLILGRDDVACVVALPRRLTVRRSGDQIEIATSATPDGAVLTVCDLDAKPLVTQPLSSPGPVRISLAELPKTARPSVVKLMAGKQMLDVAPIPEKE